MHKDFDGFCANSAKAIEKIFIRRFPSETSRPREKHNGKSLRQSCSPYKNRLQKNPAAKQRDFEKRFRKRLTFGELRCTTGFFKTVFLTFFHSRVTSEEAGFLEERAIFIACLKKCAGKTVTDCTGLTGNTAA